MQSPTAFLIDLAGRNLFHILEIVVNNAVFRVFCIKSVNRSFARFKTVDEFVALYEGVGTAASIDTVMKLGMNHPMGPLELADFIGLDVCLAILNVLHEGFGDSKYRPCPLLVKMVDAGRLGRKSGRGFHSYAS